MKRELLSFARNWNIPIIFVSTNTQEKAGDAFVQKSKEIIGEEWGFGGFVRAYVRVNFVIHVASGTAGSVGLIPIPFSDALAIAPIQAGMIYKMNDAFGMDLDKSVGASLVAGLLGVTAIVQVGRTIVNGFLKFIPVVGSVVGAVISGTTATAITEGIGFTYLKVLEKCFNDETGEVNLPDEVGMITSLFKENYLNLDTIKKLTLKP
ncbi:YcjF family protein [Helicobacter pylori]